MPRSKAHQQGAATLLVVMVLFFIISMVAAYTSRSLIFEQRTSANQYRSTQALEVADAGMEWAVAMLNFGRLTNTCTASTNVADTSFRQRYLIVDPATGKITPRLTSTGGQLTPTCVMTPTGWSCSCPDNSAPGLAAPTAAGIWPAFMIRFRPVASGTPGSTVPRQPSVIRLEVVACTRLDLSSGDPCLTFTSRGVLNEGRVQSSALLALTGNPVGMPQAALTARGAVNLASGAALTAANSLPSGLGITVHSGGSINMAGLTLVTSPGSPTATSIIQNDAAFTLTAATPFTTPDRMFATVFNMHPETFRTQLSAVTVTCPLSGCSAAAVRTAISMNPWRPLWLTGGLNVDSAGDIGSTSEPVVMVINGDLQFPTSGVTIHGLVYNRLAGSATEWTTSGSGRVLGALVAEGGVGGSGSPTLAFEGDLLKLARYNSGTFVRAPSSWRDFR